MKIISKSILKVILMIIVIVTGIYCSSDNCSSCDNSRYINDNNSSNENYADDYDYYKNGSYNNK